jgi:hypothetical protein
MNELTPRPFVIESNRAALNSVQLYDAKPLDQYLETLSPREEGGAFSLVLNIEGAAFDDTNDTGEISRILRDLADKLENGHACFPHRDQPYKLNDINGNACGEAGYFDSIKI